MPNANYTSSPLLGINLDSKQTTIDGPLVRVGTIVPVLSDQPGNIAKFAIYVQASTAIGSLNYATVDLTTVATYASSVAAGVAGSAYVRNGSVAFNASEYGWLYIQRTAIFQGP